MFEPVELTNDNVWGYVRYSGEYPGLIGDGVPNELKDVHRPWESKTVNEYLPKGGRTLELGGAQPLHSGDR